MLGNGVHGDGRRLWGLECDAPGRDLAHQDLAEVLRQDGRDRVGLSLELAQYGLQLDGTDGQRSRRQRDRLGRDLIGGGGRGKGQWEGEGGCGGRQL